MKIGFRKPSIKKSISARTTGRVKRAVKKAIIPGYGRKGMGWLTNPKKPPITRCCVQENYIWRIKRMPIAYIDGYIYFLDHIVVKT